MVFTGHNPSTRQAIEIGPRRVKPPRWMTKACSHLIDGGEWEIDMAHLEDLFVPFSYWLGSTNKKQKVVCSPQLLPYTSLLVPL